MLTIVQMEKNLERIHSWIRAVDQKISILLGFQGVMTALLAPEILDWIRVALADRRNASAAFLVLGLAGMVVGVTQNLRALTPKIKHRLPKSSITFFGDIAKRKLADFKDDIARADKCVYGQDLVAQTYVSADIAHTKHLRFSSSVKWFFVGVALIVGARIVIEFGFYGA